MDWKRSHDMTSIYLSVDVTLPVCPCMSLPACSAQLTTILYSAYTRACYVMVRGRMGTCHHNKTGSGHQNRWLLLCSCTSEKVSPISLFCVLVEFLWDFYTILSALNDTNRFILSNIIALSCSRTVTYWVEGLILVLTILNDWLLWGVLMTPELT